MQDFSVPVKSAEKLLPLKVVKSRAPLSSNGFDGGDIYVYISICMCLQYTVYNLQLLASMVTWTTYMFPYSVHNRNRGDGYSKT